MYKQVEKPIENKSRAVASSVAQKKSNGKQAFGFVDRRNGIAQLKVTKSNDEDPNERVPMTFDEVADHIKEYRTDQTREFMDGLSAEEKLDFVKQVEKIIEQDEEITIERVMELINERAQEELAIPEGVNQELQVNNGEQQEINQEGNQEQAEVNYKEKFEEELTKAVEDGKNNIVFANPNTSMIMMNKIQMPENFGNLQYLSFALEGEDSGDWKLKNPNDLNNFLDSVFGEVKAKKLYLDCAEYALMLITKAYREAQKDNFNAKTKDGFYFSQSDSTVIKQQSRIRRNVQNGPLTRWVNNKQVDVKIQNYTDDELFNIVPIGTRIAFTNDSQNGGDFRNENTVKISNDEVSALGFPEGRVFTPAEIKTKLATLYVNSINEKIKAEGEMLQKMINNVSGKIFISEAILYDVIPQNS